MLSISVLAQLTYQAKISCTKQRSMRKVMCFMSEVGPCALCLRPTCADGLWWQRGTSDLDILSGADSTSVILSVDHSVSGFDSADVFAEGPGLDDLV